MSASEIKDDDGQQVEETPLTDWKNEPSLADLKQDYTDAQEEHQKQVTIVNDYISKLNGDKTFTAKKGKSKVVPKVIRKQAEWRYPALSEPFLSADGMFKADPVTFEDKTAASQNQLILNNQMNTRIDKVDFIDEFVRTVTDEGTVIVKIGWDFEAKYHFEDQDVQDNALALEMINNGEEPTEKVEIETILKNCPTLEVCEFNNVILDPTAKGKLKKAQFIIYRFQSTMSDLEKDGRYKNLDKILVEDPTSELDSEEVPTFVFKDRPRKKVWVYEYWGFYDFNKTGIVEPFVSAWVGSTKIRMEENPFPDKELPFVSAQYLPQRKKNYGQPDGYLLSENQAIVGGVTRGIVDTMARSANAQQGTRKDALDVTNARKFEKGDDYKYNSGVDPAKAFHMSVYPEIPQSAMTMIQYQNNDAESLTGVKAFSNGGVTGEALGDNVGNARGALDAASKRELGILRRLASCMVQIGRKFISMNSEFLSETEVVRITNEDFVEVKRDDLAGNIDLKLTISTAESDNLKAQELAFMLQTGAASADPGEVRLIRAEIARLRNMPDLAKRIEEYQPQPDPLDVRMKELEIEMKEAQIINERAKGAENEVDVGLKQAKTVTERGKARDLNSTADQKDLDFVEQDTGVAHGKQKDLKDQDRLADLDGKAADAMLNADQEEKAPTESDAPSEKDISFLDDFQV